MRKDLEPLPNKGIDKVKKEDSFYSRTKSLFKKKIIFSDKPSGSLSKEMLDNPEEEKEDEGKEVIEYFGEDIPMNSSVIESEVYL